jgi:AraC-like DNA-binding protein
MQPAPPADPLALTDSIRSTFSLEARGGQFVSDDIAGARQRILEVSDGRCRFEVADPGEVIKFREAHSYVGRLAIKFLSWDCTANCETSVYRTPGHHVSLHIPLSGGFRAQQNGDWIAVGPGQILVVSAPGLMLRRWNGPCDLLNLMIGRDAVLDTFGSTPGPYGISYHPLALIDLRGEATLARFIENLISDLGSPTSAFADPALQPQVERLLLMLLAKSMHAKRSALERRPSKVAPYYVRRAEDHIARHFTSNLTVAGIARASGVSLRTLYYGFENYREQRPLELLRTTRLLHARRLLLEAHAIGGKVADIAKASGYGNASQFARDYKMQFGETPTATMRAG